MPFDDVINAQIGRMRELISSFAPVVPHEGAKATLGRWLRFKGRRYRAVVISFMDNNFIDHQTGRLNPCRLIRTLLVTIILNKSADKAIFIRHNNYPHATHPSQARLLQRLIDWYEKLFDVVVTHSGAEVGKGKLYCPLPLYRRVADTAIPVLPDLPEEYFLVFGRIARYKNIHQLIAAFPRNKNLVVAGAVADQGYVAELVAMNQGNLKMMPQYLSEAQAQSLVKGAAAVIITNADKDMVVSGSFFYAVTLFCPVYAIETPFLKWLQPRVGTSLLQLAPTAEKLCEQLAVFRPTPLGEEVRVAIEREFGDDVVRAALSKIL